MERHPIESLMGTTMENIKDMVDVNTVIGDPVRTEDGSTIIPISRVSFGFVAGGGEYGVETGKGNGTSAPGVTEALPFAGGSGAGVSVHPMGFLVVGNGQVKLLSANYVTPVDRVMELIPQVVNDLKQVLADSSGSDTQKESAKKKAAYSETERTTGVANPPPATTPEFYAGGMGAVPSYPTDR